MGQKYEEALEVFEQIKSAAEKAEDAEERILLKTDGWMGKVFVFVGKRDCGAGTWRRRCTGILHNRGCGHLVEFYKYVVYNNEKGQKI